MIVQVIEKILSANDAGETGAHQAGILVPKDPSILNFFPHLKTSIKNPRMAITMLDDAGHEWTFNFIYYNNRSFGGTRNEYRLTGMTAFFSQFNLKTGDVVIFRRNSPIHYNVSYRRTQRKSTILKISGTWKIIEAGV